MDLPKPDALRALLAAARDCGVSRLRLVSDGAELEVEMAPVTPAECILDDIERAAPLSEDPMAIIRREAAAGNKQPAQDLLDVLASGGRFIDTGNPDPTAPV